MRRRAVSTCLGVVVKILDHGTAFCQVITVLTSGWMGPYIQHEEFKRGYAHIYAEGNCRKNGSRQRIKENEGYSAKDHAYSDSRGGKYAFHCRFPTHSSSSGYATGRRTLQIRRGSTASTSHCKLVHPRRKIDTHIAHTRDRNLPRSSLDGSSCRYIPARCSAS